MKRVIVTSILLCGLIAFLSSPVFGEKETYVNDAPAFSVKYPKNYHKMGLWRGTEVLRVRDEVRGSFVVIVNDIPEGAKLSDEGKRVAGVMEKSSSNKNVKLVSSKQMKLQDGTPAILFKLEYEWRGTPLKTLGFVVFKDNKRIAFYYHFPSQRQAWGGDIEAEAMEIFKSLIFK